MLLPITSVVSTYSVLFTIAFAGFACTVGAGPLLALDLNSFRAQHGLPPLSMSGALASAAYGHAHDLASRRRLTMPDFASACRSRQYGGRNVAFGCATEDCVIRMWARSGRHRANMLLRTVTSFGLASADGGNGLRYWVLELGN